MREKHLLARLACRFSLTGMARVAAYGTLMPFVRGVNYHATAEDTRASFCRQLEYFGEHFDVLDGSGLDRFFSERRLAGRPGMLLCFDDGYEDNFGVAAAELERAGMRGWFFVVLDWIGTRNARGRAFMSWEQIAELAGRGHVVGCHTRSHARLGPLSRDGLEDEIVGAKHAIEQRLGTSVTSFCFPFGDDRGFSPAALDLAAEHYKYLFTACPGFVRRPSDRLNIGRSHVEANWPVSSVDFVCSGLLDVKYAWRKMKWTRGH